MSALDPLHHETHVRGQGTGTRISNRCCGGCGAIPGRLPPAPRYGGEPGVVSMHDQQLADQTIARALEVARACREFQCRAIVNNPDTKPANGRKSDGELAVQAESLNRMGRSLTEHGFQLRVHHHTAELAEDAREWRHILHNTDSKCVSLCLDIEHAFHGGVDPNALIRE